MLDEDDGEGEEHGMFSTVRRDSSLESKYRATRESTRVTLEAESLVPSCCCCCCELVVAYVQDDGNNDWPGIKFADCAFDKARGPSRVALGREPAARECRCREGSTCDDDDDGGVETLRSDDGAADDAALLLEDCCMLIL